MPILRCPCGHRLRVDSLTPAATCPACGGKIRIRKAAASVSERTEAAKLGETLSLEAGGPVAPPAPPAVDLGATLPPEPSASADVTLGCDVGGDEVSDSGVLEVVVPGEEGTMPPVD